MRAASFLQFGGVALTPTKGGGVINCETAFLHHFFEVAITEAYRKYQRTQRRMISDSECRHLNRLDLLRVTPIDNGMGPVY